VDHLRIEEENLIERYLMGQLAAPVAEDLEAHYVDCPQCLEQLELGRTLYLGLQQAAAEEGARTLAAHAVLAWLARQGKPLRAALATALLAAVLLPWVVLAPEVWRGRDQRERLAEELRQTQAALAPQGGTPIVALGPERAGPAAEPSARITLGTASEWVVLALDLPPEPSDRAGARYRVRLLEPGGKLLWQSQPLAPDVAGRVTVSVHSTWLAGSAYVLALDGLTAGKELRPAARYAFRVERRH
jgi:transposase